MVRCKYSTESTFVPTGRDLIVKDERIEDAPRNSETTRQSCRLLEATTITNIVPRDFHI